jgi:hypothetical protein
LFEICPENAIPLARLIMRAWMTALILLNVSGFIGA